jgi:molybdenum cofactor synthesis domain-containing protein
MVQIGILTLSDKGAMGERVDESGPMVRQMLEGLGQVVREELLPDESEAIVAKLVDWVDNQRLELIVTTGGTGLSPRDVTPQATLQVVDYEIPGMAELMRSEGLKKTVHAILSRGVVGVRRRSLIINLPGSPKAVRENLATLMPCLSHALAKLAGDPADCAR